MALIRWKLAVFSALVGVAVVGAPGYPQGLSLKTEAQLGLELSENGVLRKLEVGGVSLLPADMGDFYPVSICDVTKGTEFIPVKGKTTFDGGQAVVQRTVLPGMALDTVARYDVFKGLVRVTLTVQDTSGADRGLLVRFALPIQAEGWQWWDDLETSRKIGQGQVYENSKGIREFAALPEWADKPALKMGRHAINFCNVITGPVGLCYAVPLDQPRIFRTGYDANQKLFYIVYDVALAKETVPPSTADFTFYLYPCDPAWGMRSALDQYYRLFPGFFTKYVKKEGMWMAFSRLSDIDNANEFRFAFQEGAPEPAYDDKLGVYSLTYFTHAGMFARIPGYNPETDPEPSYDRQLAAMRETFRKRTGSAEIFDASALYDAQGKMSIKRTAVYGHIIAQYNLDPALAYGRHMLEKIPKVFQSYRDKKGGELDGFYYDGITTGINYRREH
ncbi:MAG: hypothetical protein GXP25_03310, partial [Planctomycetes bacterium]|nr:hypothetical protein [Planctomycetota bacterium]